MKAEDASGETGRRDASADEGMAHVDDYLDAAGERECYARPENQTPQGPAVRRLSQPARRDV